ncbi:MAG: hypothetical protein ABEN55_14100, partial [Bradymonadaceae bacterium]
PSSLPGWRGSVSLEQTLDGCEAILAGRGDELSEESFFMVGSFDEARQQEGGREGRSPSGNGEQDEEDESTESDTEREDSQEEPEGGGS